MKKLIALLLALCLVFGLVACGGSESSSSAAVEAPAATEATEDDNLEYIMKDGFMIHLPEYAEDLSEEDSAVNSPFTFYVDDIYITALEQPKETFGFDMTAEEYAQLIIDSNEYETTLQDFFGQTRFDYALDLDGMSVNMVTTTQVTDNSFWMISAMVEADDYEAKKGEMWVYISSAITTATGDPFVPAEEVETITVNCEEMRFVAPAEGFEDVTTEWDNGATGNYLFNNNFAMMANREDKSTVAGEPDLITYLQALMEVNAVEGEILYHDDIPYFLYEDPAGDFTYIITGYIGTEAYWFLQTYTAAEDFEEFESQMWDIICSVSVA